MPQDIINIQPKPVCYLCGNTGNVHYKALEDHLFGTPGKWTLKKCSNVQCGLIWLDPMPTLDDLSKIYKCYYTHGKSGRTQLTIFGHIIQSIFRPLIIRLLSARTERKQYKQMYLDSVPAGRLLDVGCGSGKRLRRLKSLGWQVMGQEVDPIAAEHVRKAHQIDVHLGPLETLSDNDEKFDVVIMSHVIEHVHDPIALLRTCHQLLKKDGLLIAITPNTASYGHQKFGASWRGLEPPRHLHLFTCHTLTQVVINSGFNQPNCWTTAVSAYGIGRGSQLSRNVEKNNYYCFTVRDVLRGLWLQIAASLVSRRIKDAGEECVIMAYK